MRKTRIKEGIVLLGAGALAMPFVIDSLSEAGNEPNFWFVGVLLAFGSMLTGIIRIAHGALSDGR